MRVSVHTYNAKPRGSALRVAVTGLLGEAFATGTTFQCSSLCGQSLMQQS